MSGALTRVHGDAPTSRPGVGRGAVDPLERRQPPGGIGDPGRALGRPGGCILGAGCVAALCLACLGAPARADLVGPRTPMGPAVGFEEAFDIGPERSAKGYSVQEIASSAPGNVLWSGDTLALTLQFANAGREPLKARGQLDLVGYTTREGRMFLASVELISDAPSVPVYVNIPPCGYQDITVTPQIPDRFGAYALVVDLGDHGRALAAGCVRVPRPDPGRVQYPTFSLDATECSPEEMALFQRLGVKGARVNVGYVPITSTALPGFLSRLSEQLTCAQQHDVTVLLCLGAGGPQPLGRGRPWLSDRDLMLAGQKEDLAWGPSSDPDFQEFVRIIAGKFGWPNGPLNAVELWNEPWEGMSISGWGADALRYREIYTAMAQGVEQAREESGVQVLTGGCSSSMNTEDKLFSDGKDTFLKLLDFASSHYQPMDNMSALIPEWMSRKSPRGPVRTWDTETWLADSEDRVAAFVAAERAEGMTRVACVFHAAARDVQAIRVRTDGGSKPAIVVQAWSPACGIAAVQKFIGQRPFERLLFSNGLPWVFVFDGPALRPPRLGEGGPGNGLPPTQAAGRGAADPNPDDGTAVVVGDLAAVCDRDLLRYRSVGRPGASETAARLKRELAALPPGMTSDFKLLTDAFRSARVVKDGSMTLSDGGGVFHLLDFCGNRIPAENGKLTVPLDGVAYFLRTDGSPGSFAKLLQAIQASRIDGYEPVEIVAHDMLVPVAQHPVLRLTLTNILNRPVTGKLSVNLGELTLDLPEQTVALQPNQTREVSMIVKRGQPAAGNAYPLTAVFDAGADGRVTHTESMHANVISNKTIRVDGDLGDWQGALPQAVQDPAVSPSNPADADYLPTTAFGDNVRPGFSVAYLAYDDKDFYFAAKVADDTPYPGNIRFATRDDDSYFYPDKVYVNVPAPDPGTVNLPGSMLNIFKEGADLKPSPPSATGSGALELTWPAGVRHYTYRKRPDLPSGTGTDNIILGFGVIPEGQNGCLLNPPGTMPRFMCYKCTDYEYALNQVAPEYGGGTEVWRLIAPGVPRKHYYPRQPKAAIDGGPVANAQLVVRREGNTRIVECAIPWAEMPETRKRLAAGEPIRFTFRVNDNDPATGGYELAEDRSVSKLDNYSLHDYWLSHWANEVEFGFEK